MPLFKSVILNTIVNNIINKTNNYLRQSKIDFDFLVSKENMLHNTNMSLLCLLANKLEYNCKHEHLSFTFKYKLINVI